MRARLLAACLLLSPLPAAAEVTVFAAASLKNALDQVARDFTAASGEEVVISYAGSGQLAKQIIAGAPADLFISANVQWMDQIARDGLIADGARTDLLGNTLVLIAHGGDAAPVAVQDLPALLADGRLAMALVDAVPAGQYGKAALEHLGLWDALAPAVAQTDNVRAALALVSTGEAPYGITYATDAVADDNVSVVAEFPADSYPPIVYPAALLTGATDEADRAFFDALSGEPAKAAFEAQGFRVLN